MLGRSLEQGEMQFESARGTINYMKDDIWRLCSRFYPTHKIVSIIAAESIIITLYSYLCSYNYLVHTANKKL